MILLTNENLEKQFYRDNIIEICKKFIEGNDLKEIPCGSYSIDGKELYVNIVSYETKKESDCIWEAHRKYLDIHYIVEGNERIKLANIKDMKIKDYVEEEDYVKLEGAATTEVVLKEGDFLVLFFEDAHMTGCRIDESQIIKKAIFKVKKYLIEE